MEYKFGSLLKYEKINQIKQSKKKESKKKEISFDGEIRQSKAQYG